jgi:hypothetical protein
MVGVQPQSRTADLSGPLRSEITRGLFTGVSQDLRHLGSVAIVGRSSHAGQSEGGATADPWRECPGGRRQIHLGRLYADFDAQSRGDSDYWR